MRAARNARRARRNRGFTLVEVLVAMLVMAIMAAMAWQGVDGVARARASSQERLERTLRLNTVVAQWEQDLAAIQDTTAIPISLSCDGASVRIARRTPTGLQIVAWTLRPDVGGSNANGTLERWAGPSVTTTGALQDSWMRSLQLQGGEREQLRTLTGVAQWQIYFYQGNAWSNCQSTGDVQSSTSSGTASADSAATAAAAAATGTATSSTAARQALPTGVRLVMTFAPGSGFSGELTRDVVLGP